MSEEDPAFVARLLAAARRDVAEDEAARQKQICDGVLAGGSGEGGGAAHHRAPRSWVGLTLAGLVGLGVLTALGTASLGLSRPASTAKSDQAKSILDEARVEPSPLAPAAAGAKREAAPPIAPSSETSVWELPTAPSAPAVEKRALGTPVAEMDELALELAAIESARKRLRAHDAAGAMALLADFDRRFPRPRVGDEATVLRVEVLFALGRREDARRLGRSFVEAHPDSIYRARIAQLLGDTSQ